MKRIAQVCYDAGNFYFYFLVSSLTPTPYRPLQTPIRFSFLPCFDTEEVWQFDVVKRIAQVCYDAGNFYFYLYFLVSSLTPYPLQPLQTPIRFSFYLVSTLRKFGSLT